MADASDYSRMLLFSATLHNWITLLYCQILQMILLNQLSSNGINLLWRLMLFRKCSSDVMKLP